LFFFFFCYILLTYLRPPNINTLILKRKGIHTHILFIHFGALHRMQTQILSLFFFVVATRRRKADAAGIKNPAPRLPKGEQERVDECECK